MDTRSLYETDTYTWALEQADALRRAGVSVASNAVDWANVAEEIESLGKEQAHAVVSYLAIVLEHLLKLEHAPLRDPRNHWKREVNAARFKLGRRLDANPGLKPRMSAFVDAAYAEARRLAADDLADTSVTIDAFPETCPYSLDRIREIGWFPDEPVTTTGTGA